MVYVCTAALNGASKPDHIVTSAKTAGRDEQQHCPRSEVRLPCENQHCVEQLRLGETRYQESKRRDVAIPHTEVDAEAPPNQSMRSLAASRVSLTDDALLYGGPSLKHASAS